MFEKGIVFYRIFLFFYLSLAVASCTYFTKQKPEPSPKPAADAVSIEEINAQKKYYEELIPEIEKRLSDKNVEENEKQFLKRRLNQAYAMKSAYQSAAEALAAKRDKDTTRIISILVAQLIEKERLIASLSPAAGEASPEPSEAEKIPSRKEIGDISFKLTGLYEKKKYKAVIRAADEWEKDFGLKSLPPLALYQYAVSLSETGEKSKAKIVAEEVFDMQLPPDTYTSLKIEYSRWQKADENELGAEAELSELAARLEKASEMVKQGLISPAPETGKEIQDELKKKELEKLQNDINALIEAQKPEEAYKTVKEFNQKSRSEEAQKLLEQTADIIVAKGREKAAEIAKEASKLSGDAKTAKLKEALDILKQLKENYPETTLKNKLDMNISGLEKQLK